MSTADATRDIPRRAPKRKSLEQLKIVIDETTATLMVEPGQPTGLHRLSHTSIADSAGISRAQLIRVYPTREALLAGLYAEGHRRIETVCTTAKPGAVGLYAVPTLMYDFVEQARTDAVAAVVHKLESTSTASDSGMPSIYTVWQRRLMSLLVGGGGVDGPDPFVADTENLLVEEVVDSLVAAAAGLCAPSRVGCNRATVLQQLHLVLVSTIPALCSDPRHGEHMRTYLSRMHDHMLTATDRTPDRQDSPP